MMRSGKYIVWCMFAFLFSGCFEIVEEVSYANQESGTYSVTVNCSKSKTRLKNVMKLDTLLGGNIPDEQTIRQHLFAVEKAIAATPGIAAVSRNTDFENFIVVLSFRFENTKALNDALNNAAVAVSVQELPYWTVYGFSSGVFTRKETPNDSLAAVAGQQEAKLQLISGASITSIYRFPTEIKTVSNATAQVAANKKAVLLKKSITEVILHPHTFTNTITFK